MRRYDSLKCDKNRQNSTMYRGLFVLNSRQFVLNYSCKKITVFKHMKRILEIWKRKGKMELETKIKVYLADGEEEELAKYLSESEKYSFVGKSGEAETVISDVKKLKPDILVSEVLLAGMDGFMVMQKLKEEMGENMPKVIFISNLSHSGFVSKAIREGASYFMVKPISIANVDQRLQEIYEDSHTTQEEKASKQLDEKIANIFISIGIPAHIKGYQFLREAVKLAVVEPEIIGSITKRLYPTIAEKFETSSSKVERGMRHAIEVAWNRGKIENINSLFGLKIYSSNEKPTNGELIALIADKMLMEG